MLRGVRLREPVDLEASLRGGQAFLWRHEGEEYRAVVGGAMWALRARPDGGVDASGMERSALRRYLRLDAADAARRRRLAEDPVLAAAMREYPGLRLLRQDPWETTVAFLTSANNNVLRIEGVLRKLVARYGEPLSENGERAFPSAARLARASEDDLRAAGLGYRAPFLKATAKMVAKDIDLVGLRGASIEETRATLLELPGVGPKVADCIALFSLDADDAFPVDRWVLRAANETFRREFEMRELVEFARERWGRDAGLAQQYLFHAVRVRAQAPGTRRKGLAPNRREAADT